MFKQRQDDQLATCPFNQNHTFAKEKLIFHLNRCKDREKVQHLFDKCRYNGLHFVPKNRIEEHELFCEDRDEVRKMMESMKSNFNNLNRERERSRDRGKQEELKRKEDEDQEDDDHTLSECDECLQAIAKLTLEDHPKLKKYLLKYEEISQLPTQ